MAEIMAASQEQTAGIEQVNQAVGQMDQVTQQNAALVEEAAAAAQSLQEQADKLAKEVSVFRVDGSQRHAVPGDRPAQAKAAAVAAASPIRLNSPRASRAVSTAASRPVQAAASAGGDWEEF
jgi:uncharacterized phage infection (PIP) family protein YhgE